MFVPKNLRDVQVFNDVAPPPPQIFKKIKQNKTHKMLRGVLVAYM
jgi:hypothetical protein